MHLLEDHATGEQGAESFHAKCNRLGLAFAPIKDKVKQLQCVVKEHLSSIEPQIVGAIPPPTKKNKSEHKPSPAHFKSVVHICAPTPPFKHSHAEGYLDISVGLLKGWNNFFNSFKGNGAILRHRCYTKATLFI